MSFLLFLSRHCLWILGNERTLVNSESVWEDIVKDARNRECLFDADADELLRMTIISAKKELEQLDDLVNGKSVLFRHAKWKVFIDYKNGYFLTKFVVMLASHVSIRFYSAMASEDHLQS